MKKQQKIQITLILIGLLLIFTTYFYYPYMSRTKLVEDQPAHENLESIQGDERTFFKSIEYKGFYDLNKPFTIKSEEAYMLNEEPDIVYMFNMEVILHLNDGKIMNITSDQGRYNKVSYDCYFEKNVVANFEETQILAENLDLLATKNSVKIYNEVNLNDSTGSLQADIINYNFETKYFKVSMFDNKAVKMKVIK